MTTPHSIQPVTFSRDPHKGKLTVLVGSAVVFRGAVSVRAADIHLEHADSAFPSVVLLAPGPLVLRGRAFPRRDALGVRLADPYEEPVFFLHAGTGTPPAARALWSPDLDVALEPLATHVTVDGKALRIEDTGGRIVLRIHPALFRREYEVPFFEPRRRNGFPTAPAGWCSWYQYYSAVTEADIVANTDAIAEKLLPYGCRYVQIDDGYQLGRKPEGGGHLDTLDWLRTNERFPRGMRWLAAYIAHRGLIPGIWTCPFGISNRDWFAAHPEWFVRDAAGEPIATRWPGPLVFDPTSDGYREHLQLVYETFLRWGYRYFKVDGCPVTWGFYRDHQNRLHDSTIGPDAALRGGLQQIRDIVGKESFVLTSWGIAQNAIGIADGGRVGGDVKAERTAVLKARDALLRWYFTHDVAWFADPDVFCVREPLSLEEARIWVTMIGLTGSVTMNSDNVAALPEERLELVRRCMPTTSVRPVDLFPRDGQAPRLWALHIVRPFGRWCALGVFNWDEQPLHIDVPLEQIGTVPGRPVAAWDYWEGRPAGVFQDRLKLDLSPLSCRLLGLAMVEDQPGVLSTSRHVTQGATDLYHACWRPETCTFCGTSATVPGDPYTLVLTLPQGWTVPQPPSGARVTVFQEHSCIALRWADPATETLTWSVGFARPTAAP